MNTRERGVQGGQVGETLPCVLMLLLLSSGVMVIVNGVLNPSAQQRSFQNAVTAFEQQEREASSLIEKHVAAYPKDPAGIFLAAEFAAKAFQHHRSIEFYQKLPRDNGQWEVKADLGLAQRDRVLGRMLEEEQHLRNVLKIDPTHSDANHRLGHLLQVQGRTWESAAPFMMQIRRGKCRGDELMGVATTERFFRADDDVDFAASRATQPQAVSLLGNARRLLFDNRNDEAEQLLRKIATESPHLGEAQGRLGRIIVERGRIQEFMDWRGSLPEAARQHPEVWFVQGIQARRAGFTEGAIYCFLQALRLSPNHLPANVQIAGCLELLGLNEAALVFKKRAETLSELETILNLLRDRIDEDLILKAADRLSVLHRYWEAAGWLQLLSQLEFPTDPNRPTARKWASFALQSPEQNAGFIAMLDALDLDRFAEPNWRAMAPESSTHLSQQTSPQNDDRVLQLNDEAEQQGIQVQYFEGTQEKKRLEHIFNVVGGGVAAVDFDNDGWTDLHVAQANDWRNTQPQPQWIDGLFRNRRGLGFVNVAALANMIEPGFSHGVCAEDFDQDGFTDLYVCNLGANRLFHNNGDGSFEEVTESAGVAGHEWSIGSVIADFSGDGLPDIYVGNYTKLDETAQKECYRSPGQPMACTPDVLTAESDRLYLNGGDGSFRDITEVSGIRENSGRALGMIGWDFTDSGRISLFVANDTSANFFFRNIETDDQGIPHFQEEGVLKGLAFDADGNAQASMGVAAGDANNDGRLDLFITNFSNESNTFYTQGEDGSFYDFTRQFDLRDSGYTMLGFGTQFADVDGDGWEDLLASNGHVDQSAASPDADKMKPQLFRNLNGERFVEIPATSAGTYFQKSYLGRSVATLDWNKDGHLDFAVSHLHAPFALVTNRTPWESKTLVIRLVGRTGVRSSAGARVRARIAGRDWFRLSLAGDGYLVTNEHQMRFAVPAGKNVEEVEVQWPGGFTQKWTSMAADHEWGLIEGRTEAVLLDSIAN